MKTFVSGWGAQWTPSVIFGVLVIMMIFKPTGLLASTRRTRCKMAQPRSFTETRAWSGH